MNPSDRLTAEEVLQSDFFMKGRVPRRMAASTRQLTPSRADLEGLFESGVVDMKEIMAELRGFGEPLKVEGDVGAPGEETEGRLFYLKNEIYSQINHFLNLFIQLKFGKIKTSQK